MKIDPNIFRNLKNIVYGIYRFEDVLITYVVYCSKCKRGYAYTSNEEILRKFIDKIFIWGSGWGDIWPPMEFDLVRIEKYEDRIDDSSIDSKIKRKEIEFRNSCVYVNEKKFKYPKKVYVGNHNPLGSESLENIALKI